jgi:hypothetical protein
MCGHRSRMALRMDACITVLQKVRLTFLESALQFAAAVCLIDFSPQLGLPQASTASAMEPCIHVEVATQGTTHHQS